MGETVPMLAWSSTVRTLAAVAAVSLAATACGGSGGDDPAEASVEIDAIGIGGDPIEFASDSDLLIRCLDETSDLGEDAVGIAYSSPRFLDWIDLALQGKPAEPPDDLLADPDSFLLVEIANADIELGRELVVDTSSGIVFIVDDNGEIELSSNARADVGVTVEFDAAPCIDDGDELDVRIQGQLGDEDGGGVADIDITLRGTLTP